MGGGISSARLDHEPIAQMHRASSVVVAGVARMGPMPAEDLITGAGIISVSLVNVNANLLEEHCGTEWRKRHTAARIEPRQQLGGIP